MKRKFPFVTLLALVLGMVSLPNAQAQESAPAFSFPPGVDWSNATPDQIAESVYNAVKANPGAAPDIASAGLLSAADTNRWSRPAAQDGKQTTDPDGSSGDPGIQDIANVISDAAKRGNPAMAPQIDSAIRNTLSSLPPAGSGGSGSSGGGDGGGGGSGGAAPPLAPIPGGGGGGGGGGTGPTSN